ncbi:YfbK domain-containing protein [Solitalea lacus]|uniref:YfbK domain-containing protein n=1 Tax=Solitalea lacus TaxID=2911172 RepID=UPI001EDBCBCC|nr:von Willebrand factor type A domain-containing protein [Solitalea lacus]UKJ08013.1 von Willebrand factor type A domain-containing protein [Solitalea lacus]
MKTLFHLFTLAALFAFTNCSQQKVLQGQVKSAETGAHLKNAEIILKGTKLTSHTNFRGRFNLKLNDSANVIIVKAKGFEPKEIKLTDNEPIEVMVVPEGHTLYEVIVPMKESMLKEEDKTMIRASAPVNDSKVYYKHTQGITLPAQPPTQAQPKYNTEDYSPLNENGFKLVTQNPLSTFSIDVDNASYSNIRRFINQGSLPPVDAVRIEEMINYFDYNYDQPTSMAPVAIHTEMATCPWNSQHQLARIGIQARKVPIDNLPASNLVFLIDVSGSMDQENKLPLVKSAFKLLVDKLRSQDRVSIVVYAGAAGVVLPSTEGNEKTKIKNALNQLEAGGSTAGGEGIKLAYNIARQNFIAKGNNRVILATDGDFNVGVSSDGELQRLIEEERKSGVFLSVLGFGMGNYKDNKLELLANKGNGNYAYIDNFNEARRVFVNEFAGTLFTLAKDVKLQIEFNPLIVQSYRLIGYENRLLNDEDFNNDKIDAGEIGAGQTVTALYEIIPQGVKSDFLPVIDKLKYQSEKPAAPINKAELLTVKLRYKEPNGDNSKLISNILQNKSIPIGESSNELRFAAAVAEFGMLLRKSPYKNNANYDQLIQLASTALKNDNEGYKHEFLRLVKTARELTLTNDKAVVNLDH